MLYQKELSVILSLVTGIVFIVWIIQQNLRCKNVLYLLCHSDDYDWVGWSTLVKTEKRESFGFFLMMIVPVTEVSLCLIYMKTK